MLLYNSQCLWQQLFTLKIQFSFINLSMTTCQFHVTNPQTPGNFLAYSHQLATSNYKYFQYNQTFCFHSQDLYGVPPPLWIYLNSVEYLNNWGTRCTTRGTYGKMKEYLILSNQTYTSNRVFVFKTEVILHKRQGTWTWNLSHAPTQGNS